MYNVGNPLSTQAAYINRPAHPLWWLLNVSNVWKNSIQLLAKILGTIIETYY